MVKTMVSATSAAIAIPPFTSLEAGAKAGVGDATKLWQDEKRLREAILFANVCGALTVTQRGAIPALPTREAVLQFLSNAVA